MAASRYIMKLLEIIKQRQHRPALIIAVTMLAYSCFFTWPKVEFTFWRLMHDLRFLLDSPLRAFQCVFRLYELVYHLACVAIWFLSVFLTWAAYRRSRTKAYLFILAFLLLPLVIQPARWIIKHSSLANNVEDMARDQESSTVYVMVPDQIDGEATIVELKEPARDPAAITAEERRFRFPLRELLVLLGVYYLYRKEVEFSRPIPYDA